MLLGKEQKISMRKTTIKVLKLNPDAILPFYANDGDAGMDICAISREVIPPGEWRLIRTGISLEIPTNMEAQVRPRSGLSLKHGITVLNSPGTIDAGYRGEIGVILINHGSNVFVVEEQMRIAQLIFAYVAHVELVPSISLSETTRGIGGFGSSGVHLNLEDSHNGETTTGE